MLQGPGGWCFDWPSGDSIFPPTVCSIRSAGRRHRLRQPQRRQDRLRDRPHPALSIAEQGPEWGKFDKWLTETYLPVLPYYWDKGNFVFGTKVHNVVDDPNNGMPFLEDIWVDQ